MQISLAIELVVMSNFIEEIIENNQSNQVAEKPKKPRGWPKGKPRKPKLAQTVSAP